MQPAPTTTQDFFASYGDPRYLGSGVDAFDDYDDDHEFDGYAPADDDLDGEAQ